jgi:hypothetical protein
MAQTRGRQWSEEGNRFDRCKQDAIRILTQAADEWAEGDPTIPDPPEIIEKILAIFAEESFLRRPFGKARP